jgi:hypothetical protein
MVTSARRSLQQRQRDGDQVRRAVAPQRLRLRRRRFRRMQFRLGQATVWGAMACPAPA